MSSLALRLDDLKTLGIRNNQEDHGKTKSDQNKIKSNTTIQSKMHYPLAILAEVSIVRDGKSIMDEAG
jgi:hypothetical protein